MCRGLQLFQSHFTDEPLSFGEGDHDHAMQKPVDGGCLHLEEEWRPSWPGCPSGAALEDTEVPITTSAPSAAPPSTANGPATVSSAVSPALAQACHPSQIVSEQYPQPPAPFPGQGDHCPQVAATFPCPGFAYPSVTSPAGACSAAAMAPGLPGAWGSHAMQYMAAMVPSSMVLMPQMAPWMTYMPASLRPPPVEDEETAAQRIEARQSKLARFQKKKQQLSCRKAVRYASRKRYADSRPRVNGRFISKADGAAAARTAAA